MTPISSYPIGHPVGRLLLVASAVVSLLAGVTNSQCYAPDGSAAPDGFRPCTWNEGVAAAVPSNINNMCCYRGDHCWSNGICHTPAQGKYLESFHQGACEAADWTGCIKTCETDDVAHNSYVRMANCGPVPDPARSIFQDLWACEDGNATKVHRLCETKGYKYTLDHGKVFGKVEYVSNDEAVAPFSGTTNSNSQCFTQDGSPAGDKYGLCQWRDPQSVRNTIMNMCCRLGDSCLHSGLCYTPAKDNPEAPETYHQGSCRIKDWTQCLKHCTAADVANNPYVQISLCGPSERAGYNKLVCNDATTAKGGTACKAVQKGTVVELEDINLARVLGSVPVGGVSRPTFPPFTETGSTASTAVVWLTQTLTLVPKPAQTTTSSSSSVARETTTVTAQPTTTSSTSVARSRTETTTVTSLSAATATIPPAVSTSGPPDPNDAVPLAVGISVGGIAVVAAVGLGVWIHRQHRRNQPARAVTPPPVPQGRAAYRFDFDREDYEDARKRVRGF